MGRALGGQAAAGGFDVLGTRRGSPQMQAERDKLEAEDVRAGLAKALTGPLDTRFAELSRLARQRGLEPESPLYREFRDAAAQMMLKSALNHASAALVQLSDMCRDGTLADGDGDLLCRAIYDWLDTVEEIPMSVRTDLIATITGPAPDDPEFETGNRDYPQLLNLASAYGARLERDFEKLAHTVKLSTAERDSGRFRLMQSVLTPASRVTPGGRNLERLAPLIFAVAQEVKDDPDRLTGEQFAQLRSCLDEARYPEQWAWNPLRRELAAALEAQT